MSDHFAILNGHHYMNLITYRKDGSEVSRPVWFAQSGQTLYGFSDPDAGKVKHMRHNPQLWVTPADIRGNLLSDQRAAGTAQLFEDASAEGKVAQTALRKKYGLQFRWIMFMDLIRRGKSTWFVIAPRIPEGA
ncbi:MAG: PPOX class F420-dependent oxidoreductase [Phototrophicaceae bacterium]|jgi:PPOX class probable F420-dependent enzyme